MPSQVLRAVHLEVDRVELAEQHGKGHVGALPCVPPQRQPSLPQARLHTCACSLLKLLVGWNKHLS